MQKLFLVGAPRSGTTWLQILLAQHAEIATVRETHLFELYLGRMYERWSFEEKSPEADGLRVLLSDDEFDALCRTFATAVFDRIAQRNPAASVVLEKTPGHIGRHRIIKRLFPDAKFLNIVRDPRSVVASMLAVSKQSWGWWAQKDATAAAEFWRESVRIGRDELRAYGNDCMEVRYEDLSADTNAVLTSIHSWLGIAPTPIDDLSKFSVTELNARSQQGDRSSPTWESRASFFRKGSVHGWKDELTRKQIAQVQEVCGDLMQTYGYGR